MIHPSELAITTVTYGPCDLDDALGSIRDAGFAGVELVYVPGHCDHYDPAMDDAAVSALKEKLAGAGLRLACLGAATGLMSAESVDQFCRAVSLAPRLGTRVVVNSIAGASGREEDLDAFYAHVGPALACAEEHDVTIALELHGEHTGNGRSMLEVIRKVNHPRLKINYDTANCMFHGGQWPYEDLEIALPEVVNLHLKDKIDGKGIWNFPPVGAGEVDFDRVFAILGRGGYRGAMSVEIEFDEQGFPALEEIGRAAASARRQVLARLEGSGAR